MIRRYFFISLGSVFLGAAILGIVMFVWPTTSSLHAGAPNNTDLAIIKTGPATVSAQQKVMYTMYVANNGGVPADHVIVTDYFSWPAGSTWTDVSGGICSASPYGSIYKITCDMGTLGKPGKAEQKVLTLGFQLTGCGYATQNYATVTPGAGDTYHNPAISSTITTTVTCPSPTGSLFVAQDSIPVRNHQILGGTTGDAVLRLAFTAAVEDIDVTNLQLSSVNAASLRSIDRVNLYKEGSLTPFASATIGGCGTDIVPPQTLCANMQSKQLVIPKGQRVVVLVRPVAKTDVDGAVSGDALRLFVSGKAVANNATGEGAVRARGVTSANNLIANNGDSVANGEVFIGRTAPAPTNQDIVGNPHVIVLSKITGITNANPDPDGSNVPVGVADVGQFQVSAALNANSKNGLNKIVIGSIFFNINATNVAVDGSSLKFFNKANASITISCTPIATNGSPLSGSVTGLFLAKCVNGSGVNTLIDQGTSQTFVLRMNVLSPQANRYAASALQVSLQNFTNSASTAFGVSNSHFQWFDQDNASSSSYLWVEYPDNVVKSTTYQN